MSVRIEDKCAVYCVCTVVFLSHIFNKFSLKSDSEYVWYRDIFTFKVNDQFSKVEGKGVLRG